MAIIKELQKVAPFGRIENRQPPVVEDEELNATDGFEQAAIAAVASSEGERIEQARDAMILDRAIVAASFVAEGASNPTFAQPGRAHDILPKNIRSKLSFNIRIIHAPVSASLL